jgi:demethylmenaquinone methyltransferase/2-methoxy-6-polyprenyl-1,4-benzoquinol methylase
MFARIAPRYDRLNRVLSARRDLVWRRQALALLDGAPGDVLDLACGTFDFAQAALAAGKARRVHGCDFCLPMLHAGDGKRAQAPISAANGDAMRLPYADGAFDAALIAYGWRNFPDAGGALDELHRVLRPGGQVLILEFFRPERLWPRLFYGTFGRFVMPVVGGMLAGDRAAYRYLNDSVQGFLSTAAASDLLAQRGFGRVRWRPFFGGISHAVAATRG